MRKTCWYSKNFIFNFVCYYNDSTNYNKIHFIQYYSTKKEKCRNFLAILNNQLLVGASEVVKTLFHQHKDLFRSL